MTRINKRICLSALFWMAGASVTFAAQKVHALPCSQEQVVHEQTHFSAEDDQFQHPCELPEEAIALLRSDRRVGRELADIPAGKSPSSLFTATAVNLHSPVQNDIIVMGIGSLRGANVCTFWVFIQTPQGLHMAVKGTPVHDLNIRKTRTHDYRDLELLSATAVAMNTSILDFDGKDYRLNKRRSSGWKPIL